MTRCCIVVLLLVLALPASAQTTGTLSGQVTDAMTGETLVGANVFLPEIQRGTATDIDGNYVILGIPVGTYTVQFSFAGYETKEITQVEITAGRTRALDVSLGGATLGAVEVVYERPLIQNDAIGVAMVRSGPPPPPPASPSPYGLRNQAQGNVPYYVRDPKPLRPGWRHPTPDREQYAAVEEQGFVTPLDAPLSTFSIDVDRASYANARRMIEDGYLPPRDAVRVEEFVNAFEYDVPGPDAQSPHPFAVHTEVAEAPWAPEHRLVRIALQGRRLDTQDLPPLNLVFLLDVSGSMNSPDKLGLVKQGMRLLTQNLRPQDHVAMVVYADAAGLVLPPTNGTEKTTIYAALDRLHAGGSTAGGAGIRLAYDVARQHFDPEATNRVILATDGDFNVGASSDAEMRRLIEKERESGVFLSVLGVGTGNLQDAKMEAIADHGNGNYAYLDSIREAEKVLVREMGGTLVALAKDVKIQVEFNPALVAGYRLIGYENRRLADEDFNDDQKDAGELGAGHAVTALYEIIPTEAVSQAQVGGTDPLRYQTTGLSDAAESGELLTVKLRYKPATGPGTFADESVLLSASVRDTEAGDVERASEAMRWAVAVAEAALLLQESEYVPGATWDHALALAQTARGQDPHGDRAEFIRLIETARTLAQLRQTREQPQALAD
ncbi:MAG: von Willebrand factor type A domain-containing protein [Bacteroidota bacterium]